MKLVLLLATLATLLASAASAAAAPVVTVGQGDKPDIAVDATGRAHIAFLNKEGSFPQPEEARYCSLPRGGTGCQNPKIFVGNQPLDAEFTTGRAHVFAPGANNLIVAHERCCGPENTVTNRSVNGGSVFGPPVILGNFIAGTFDEAVYGPGDTITALAEVVSAGTQVQNGPVSGLPAPASGAADLLAGISGEGAIGLEGDGSPVAVFVNQDTEPDSLLWSKLNDGVPPTTPNINTTANWTPNQLISNNRTNAAEGPALAGGPNGLFLFWQKRLPDEGFISKFTGSGFTAPVKITDNRPFNDFDLHQDPAGRLHAVWNQYTDEKLRYSFSDNGVNWSTPVDIARGESYTHVRVAAASDHRGFAVWDDASTPAIDAVPLEALPSDAPPDATDPAVSDLDIGDSTLTPGQGTKFTFRASEAGTARLVIEKRVKGLRLKKGRRLRCLPSTKKRLRKLRKTLAKSKAVKTARGAARRRALRRLLRKRRCTAFKRIGTIRKAVTAGRNEIVFNGRIAGRRLSPGRYRARLTVTDSAGNVSRVEAVSFRVIARRQGKRRR